MAVQKSLFGFPVALAAAGFFLFAGASQSRADILVLLCGTGNTVCYNDGYVDTTGGLAPDPNLAASVINGVTFNPTGDALDGFVPDYIYNYALQITSQQQAIPPTSYVTLYDIPGFVVGSAIADTTSLGASTSEQLTGITPTALDPACCSGVPDNPNMWNVTWSALFQIQGPSTDSLFAYESIYGPNTQYGYFSAQAYFQGNNPTINDNAGAVLLPAAPEPTTMFLMGGALLGLGVIRKKRHQ